MTTSQVWCQTHWHKVIRCKGESPESWLKCIVSLNDSQVFVDPLIKGLPHSVYRERTVDMGLWYSLCFPDNKDPKVKKICFKTEMCIVAVESIGNWPWWWNCSMHYLWRNMKRSKTYKVKSIRGDQGGECWNWSPPVGPTDNWSLDLAPWSGAQPKTRLVGPVAQRNK